MGTIATVIGALPQIVITFLLFPTRRYVGIPRGELDSAAIPEQLRAQVQSVDSHLPVFGARMLDDVLADSLSERRFSMEILAAFALTALLLAGLGIYGVISFVVGQRTHEIGIRLAMGAQRGSIFNIVLREGMRLAAVGAAMGLVAALIATNVGAGTAFQRA